MGPLLVSLGLTRYCLSNRTDWGSEDIGFLSWLGGSSLPRCASFYYQVDTTLEELHGKRVLLCVNFMWICACECRHPQRHWLTPTLELQTVVSYPTCMLETELRSSPRELSVCVTTELFLQSLKRGSLFLFCVSVSATCMRFVPLVPSEA